MSMFDLFTKDPMKMTKDDIDSIIEHFREQRKKFIQNPAAVKGKPTKAKPTDGLSLGVDL